MNAVAQSLRQLAEKAKHQKVTWHEVRHVLSKSASEIGVWSGVPLPVEDLRIRIEDRYPFKVVEKLSWTGDELTVDSIDSVSEWIQQTTESTVRNYWYSVQKSAWVFVVEKLGKVRSMIVPRWDSRKTFDTLRVASSEAWSTEAEEAAMRKLRSMIGEHKYKCYLTSGMFLESSRRSNVAYLFRRLRPTVAISLSGKEAKPMVALCMHPVGYYTETWAGVMVPTDDVIAHLVMMRGDEHRFWKTCNQHPLTRAEAGWILASE